MLQDHMKLGFGEKVSFPLPWNLALIGPAVSETIFENGGGVDDDGRMDATISSPCEPDGSDELKNRT